ncbi:MAG: bifunctional N-acetylglucosamine-1-phosphate uridyltransferase/glucosamine-1-phosphate acetyltransferase [Acidimicrobiales bacterium]
MSTPGLSAVILAAGEGTRMRSDRPKPLHLLCGKAMLLYVIDALAACDIGRAVVVVGHGAEQVTKKLQEQGPDLMLDFVEQRVQRGTGDAVSVGLTAFGDDVIDDDLDLLVLPGDTPLLRPETLAALVEAHRSSGVACTVLTARLDDPTGYGRIVRGKEDAVSRIVEQSDATADELAIDEINTGIYCFRRSLLSPSLRRLSPENAQGEYYLTDVVSVLAEAGHPVATFVAPDAAETHGVNDRVQLADAEAELRARTNRAWLRRGVTMVDPASTYVDATVELAADVTLFPGVVIQGRTVVGPNVEIGPGTRLVDCVVGAGVSIDQTVARDAEIGDGARVGPFAVLEPGAQIPPGAVTGAFYTAGDSEAPNRTVLDDS